MHERPIERGGEPVTTEVQPEPAEIADSENDEKSFFARGALLGLAGGVLAAILLISVGGSVVSLVDDLFGSQEVEAAGDASGGSDSSLIAQGRNLTATCVGCHTTDGVDTVGPTWQALAGSERLLENGETVIADTEYIKNSIIDPNDQIVAGFAPDQMPTNYGETFSAEELEALIAYLESL
ncbi:MAG: cytochrome c [Acidimicrobiia bacterium]|nr:cytochrome c [Acidimicrobiia bacterium]